VAQPLLNIVVGSLRGAMTNGNQGMRTEVAQTMRANAYVEVADKRPKRRKIHDRVSDQVDSGNRLAARPGDLREQDVFVLGLTRNGVQVASEVADVLDATPDVIVVRGRVCQLATVPMADGQRCGRGRRRRRVSNHRNGW
jgi:hypothetical protein